MKLLSVYVKPSWYEPIELVSCVALPLWSDLDVAYTQMFCVLDITHRVVLVYVLSCMFVHSVHLMRPKLWSYFQGFVDDND